MEFNQESILKALSLMSSWEILASILGIAYILLLTKESLWAWVFGFFSTLIYTILFWEGALVSSSLLNFYYMLMAFYGFYSWNRGTEDDKLKISSYKLSNHLEAITTGILFTLIIGYLSSNYTDAKFAYMDSFVMVFSIIATWMVTQKILENWIYWIIVDLVAIVLYWNSGYLATVVLFMVYITLGSFGYFKWRKEFNDHN